MLRIISVCFAFTVLVQAQTLEAIIEHSLASHNSLKSIEQKLSALDESLELTQNFANPELLLSVSDIQFNDPASRSIEPMQYESIALKQKIPYFGKRGANASYVNAQKSVVYSSMEMAKTALVREVKLTAYTIWEFEKERAILEESLELNRKNIELGTIYTLSESSLHMQTMGMKLFHSQLKIKRSRITSILGGLYAKLSYLASMKIDSLEMDVKVTVPKSLERYLELLSQNRAYQYKSAQVGAKSAFAELKEYDSKIDPVVQLGYFHRASFEDYLSFSIGASLPVYGNESLRVQQARKELLEAKFAKSDLYEKLKSDLHNSYAQLINSYEIYKILATESLPQVEHMFDLAGANINNGKNLLSFTSMLEKKLDLQEQKISAIASYKRAQTEIDALVGEIK